MNNQTRLPPQEKQADDIDLTKVFGVLLDNIWLIVVITGVFLMLGVAYALLSTPIYKADALLQIESKSSGMSALVGDMGEMISNNSSSNTEIEIITSRMILGKTVDKLNLTILARPYYLPYIGKGIARIVGKQNSILVSRFDVSSGNSSYLTLKLEDASQGKYSLYNNENRKILDGVVGELAFNDSYSLFVQSIVGENKDEFLLGKRSREQSIGWIKQNLSIDERGLQTGVLELAFVGEDKVLVENILNDISQNYLLQNVKRNSAEAEKSLEFLKGHLPSIQVELTSSEDALNRFRQDNESIDLGLEAQSTLKVMLSLEAQLNDLTFKESEISKRFTKDHPAYKSLLDKRAILLGKKDELNTQVQKLPKTQRDVLRMKRDVEVNQQIYIQLLNKVQELNILKAGTVGNVRILDAAQSYSSPIKPRKLIIVILSTMLGGFFAFAFVILKFALYKGVESPDEIEALGLSVYASIPMSDFQAKMNVKLKQKIKKDDSPKLHQTLLAVANPADLAIEALRGLRTSMHFAMMEAKNNVVMISGPGPGIGKSFVSVNFATVMAKTDQKVLLVDADMRKGYIQKHFSLHWMNGLSELLSGKLATEKVIKDSHFENLDIVTRGQVPPNPSELLMNSRFTAFVEWASDNYDLVIIDTPPVLAVTDASIVGSVAGTTLMVGRFGQNTAKEIDVARHRFEMAGVDVKGFILNAVEKKASTSYGYYNYSYESDKS
ncbi:tyrosine protein kinase [Marinomonas sp. SBI22]|uniref:polysaccharide biosynthesis tyrosine autokinase n=1 Tax=unclassified Marinomonas TaxID=196814 RepID=UPI0007AF1971|nr:MULTISPECIES: polysaccharide biosynthesis tyrosine autokinase [unclassified Marinomonas]KZM44888.1 tyrosine protein kinase [Marinomonas sp. SBI22]KZM46587.1 tyrosine protein kinase [Marinomonas sp. SBI8L]